MPGNTATPASVLPPEPFIDEVRTALDHLYDYAFLHNHPLAWRLCSEASADGVTRVQRVRTLLLDAIEHLRPEHRPRSETAAGVAAASDEMRAYAIVNYRCMDSMSMDEIAGKLGLSRRQAYREYAKSVEAVASMVWDALPAEPVTLVTEPGDTLADPTRLSAAAEEVTRLAGNLMLEQVDLESIAQEVASLLAPRVQHTGVALRVLGSDAALPSIADRALLRQALLNLFSYALDQTGRGGEVDVTCSPSGREMALWLTTCRGDEQPVTRREGVGVTVAQKLIEAMGGQVLLQQVGIEWRCSLQLPAVQRDIVLVVDDNADLTALFQRYAAGHNLTVVGATSGVQALELAKELLPQLIILDLMLSQMDGWEILQRLRRSKETKTTPIVICSVLNEPHLAYSMGASDYVTKPISQATLVDVLRRWLGTLHPAV